MDPQVSTDHPRPTDTAFREAGLLPLLYTPNDDPDAPWPTLDTMIHDNRRLVLFKEKDDGPMPWYRNFYRYGMETPYSFKNPADFTGGPAREDAGLVNGEQAVDAGLANHGRGEPVQRGVADACER